MKIIHCADLHLDSSMKSIIPDEARRRERRSELLNNFTRLVEYAVTHEIHHIIIAGDLFDTSSPTRGAVSMISGNISSHKDIQFYYLLGNHDSHNVLCEQDNVPENLHTFDDSWKSYDLTGDARVILTGMELTKENSAAAGTTLLLKPDAFNIVTLHGQAGEHISSDRAQSIDLSSFRNRNIDYMALGHVHRYMKGSLDARGTWCYSGCLEGRGFDEAGEHGFVVLDVDPDRGTYTDTFVPFAQRRVIRVETDITGLDSTAEVIGAIEDSKLPEKDDLVDLVLTGNVDPDAELDTELVRQHFSDRFYACHVSDETRIYVDYSSFEKDQSLKGEFIRQVKAREDLTEEEKGLVIRYGIQAVMGEEIS